MFTIGAQLHLDGAGFPDIQVRKFHFDPFGIQSHAPVPPHRAAGRPDTPPD